MGHKLNKRVRKPNFSDQFKKIIKRNKRVVNNMDIMRQSACLVVNRIMVYSFGFLFNCKTVGKALIRWLVPDACQWHNSSST